MGSQRVRQDWSTRHSTDMELGSDEALEEKLGYLLYLWYP